MKLKNISTGDRGVYTEDGDLIMVRAGETVEGEFEDFAAEWFAEAPDPLDHDGNGKKGGAKKPVASDE